MSELTFFRVAWRRSCPFGRWLRAADGSAQPIRGTFELLAANEEQARLGAGRILRACTIVSIEPSRESDASLPTKAGHYWAKWRIPEDGTRHDPCPGARADWEVVQVFENGTDRDDPAYLIASVPGVEKAQSLENFFWGPGPLEAPKP